LTIYDLRLQGQVMCKMSLSHYSTNGLFSFLGDVFTQEHCIKKEIYSISFPIDRHGTLGGRRFKVKLQGFPSSE
jgi:hypothetical protein